MHRLFVAIRPTRPVRERLLAMMGGVANARWQDDDQLHLSVRFIGEVDRRRAEDVSAGLASLRQQRFQIALSGVGGFEARGKGVLWAGIAPHGELKMLHKKVDQACQRAGLLPEARAYLPHITLARLNRSSGPVEPFIERWAGLSSEPFSVDSFALYESRLGSEGASYTLVERYSLS